MALFDSFIGDLIAGTQGQGPLAGHAELNNPLVHRLVQHVQDTRKGQLAIASRDPGQMAPEAGNIFAALLPMMGIAGLGLEGTRAIGEGAAGLLAANTIGQQHEVDPQKAAQNQALVEAMRQDGPRGAFQAATHDPRGYVSWPTGAAAMLLDPSNLIGGGESNAAKKAAQQGNRIKEGIKVGDIAKEADLIIKQGVDPTLKALPTGGQHLLPAGEKVAAPAPEVADTLVPQAATQASDTRSAVDRIREAILGQGPHALKPSDAYVPAAYDVDSHGNIIGSFYSRFGLSPESAQEALDALAAEPGWEGVAKGIRPTLGEVAAATDPMLGSKVTVTSPSAAAQVANMERRLDAIKARQKVLRPLIRDKNSPVFPVQAAEEMRALEKERMQIGKRLPAKRDQAAQDAASFAAHGVVPGTNGDKLAGRGFVMEGKPYSKDFTLVDTPPGERGLQLQSDQGLMHQYPEMVDYQGPTGAGRAQAPNTETALVPYESQVPQDMSKVTLDGPGFTLVNDAPTGTTRAVEDIVEGDFREIPPVAQPGEYGQAPGLFRSFLDATRVAHSQGKAAQSAAMGLRDQPVTLGRVYQLWKQQIVNTPRNPMLDWLTTHLWATNSGVKSQLINDNFRSLVARAKLYGPGDVNALLPESLGVMAERTGLGSENVFKSLGQAYHQDEAFAAALFAPKQSALIETAFALLNPAKAALSPVAIPVGYLKGYLRPYQNKLITTMTDMVSTAGRSAVFEDEFGKALQEAAGQFADRLGSQHYGANLDLASGLFSVADVQREVGTEAAKVWGQALHDAAGMAEAQTKRVMGDFTKGLPGEKLIDNIIPFTRWALRAYPRTAQILMDHPAVALTIYHAAMADAIQAQLEGRKGYTIGTIPVSSGTPVIGKLVDLLTGGAPGVTRINPLAALSPMGVGGLGAGDDLANAKTLYEKASALGSVVGMQPRPEIQYGAFLTGQTDKQPGATSRAAGLEDAIGPAELPTSQRPLNALRTAISGKAGVAYDPIQNRAAELVYADTKKPLTSVENVQYALDIANKTGHYYETAAKQLQRGGLAKNLASAFTPVSSTTQTDINARYQQSRQGLPYEYADISKETDPKRKAAMQQANDAFIAQHPEAGLYSQPQLSPAAKKSPKLALWEVRNEKLKQRSPGQYATQRARFMRANNIAA